VNREHCGGIEPDTIDYSYLLRTWEMICAIYHTIYPDGSYSFALKCPAVDITSKRGR
jgi:hypothetical protein